MLLAAALLPVRAVARQTLASPPHPGAISGVVTDGATGRPLPGAIVTLGDTRVKVSAATLTDSKGRFVFAGLPVSAGYRFTAVKSGYAAVGDAVSGPTITYPLSEGEWLPHADVVLWPFGTIGGTVVDEQGEPVVGIPVAVLARVAYGGRSRWVPGPMSMTDDRGVYRLQGLQRGTYVVHVPNVQSTVPPSSSPATVAGVSALMAAASPETAPPATGLDRGSAWLVIGRYAVVAPADSPGAVYPPLYYPGSRSFSSAAPIELAGGEDRAGIDFALAPVPAVSISGRVVGPADALPGLVVRLLPAGSPVEAGNSEQATALVNAGGAFSMVGVPAGSYTLAASTATSALRLSGSPDLVTPGLVRGGTLLITLGSPVTMAIWRPVNQAVYFGRATIDVGTRDVSNVVIELKSGPTISGRVVNEDGSTVRGALNVGVSSSSSDWRDSAPASPAGTFVLQNLSEGDYRLDVSSLATPLVVKSIVLAGGDYTDRPIHAELGAEIDDVVVTMTDRPATLRGLVHDRNGAAVAQSTVVLFPADPGQRREFGENPPRIRSVRADGQRGFTLSRLRAGGYLAVAVEVSQSEAWRDPRFLDAAAPLATPVTLDWGVTTTLNLTLQQVVVR